MTAQQDPHATQRLDQATQRLDQATQRLDALQAEDATVRLDPAQDATQRLDPATQRLDEATQRLAAAIPAPAATPSAAPDRGEFFAAGQHLEFNGVAYEIVRELNAQSGEAVTYVVRESGAAGQEWVLKHYRPGVKVPADLLGKIRDLPHGDIVRVRDFGRRNAQDFEIMEFARGGSLADLLREKGALRDLAALKRIAAEVDAGLQHLHGAIGAIYQDLKPDNILFRDASRSDVVLADFGISSLIAPGSQAATVKAHGTREYAAPELARFGNQTDAQVDAGVDYFALGITLLECWNGQRPFQGVPDAARLAQVRDKTVAFPDGMDAQLATLIKGLINPLPRERWGHAHVQAWLADKPLELEYQATRRPYETRSFNDQETFSTPAELAELLHRYPDKGKDYLFLGRIKEWLDRANDMALSTEIEKLMRQFDKADAGGDKYRNAGLYMAIHVLAPDRPFVTVAGRVCTTQEQVGDAFLVEQAHYRQALANPLEPFYLYLQATGDGQAAANLLPLFAPGQPADFAFNMAVYLLQGEGEERIKLNGTYYHLPEDVNTRTDAATRARVGEQLLTDNSLVLIWLKRLGYIGKLKGLGQTDSVEVFALIKAFPWLKLREVLPDWSSRQAALAMDLIRQQRADLLDIFLAQGLSFDSLNDKGTGPLHDAALNDRVSMIDYLLDHGASVDLPDDKGMSPLFYALFLRREAAVRRLLERGAQADHLDAAGNAALLLACVTQYNGNQRLAASAELIDLLLERGADPNRASASGQLPLHLALWNAGSGAAAQAVLNVFLKHKADLKRSGADVSPNKWPACAAQWAAVLASELQYQNGPEALAVVSQIIRAGVPVDALCAGRTPLQYAAGRGSEALCKTLLDVGASRARATDDDQLPVNFARMKRNKSLADLLDPGLGFGLKARVLVGLGLAAKTLALLALLLSLSVLGQLGLPGTSEGIPAWIAGYLGIHLLAAVFLVVMSGSLGLVGRRIRATVSYARGATLYLVVMPLSLPLLLSFLYLGLQWLGGWLLPQLRYAGMPGADGLSLLFNALAVPANLLNRMDPGMSQVLATLVVWLALAALASLLSRPARQLAPVWEQYQAAKKIK